MDHTSRIGAYVTEIYSAMWGRRRSDDRRRCCRGSQTSFRRVPLNRLGEFALRRTDKADVHRISPNPSPSFVLLTLAGLTSANDRYTGEISGLREDLEFALLNILWEPAAGSFQSRDFRPVLRIHGFSPAVGEPCHSYNLRRPGHHLAPSLCAKARERSGLENGVNRRWRVRVSAWHLYCPLDSLVYGCQSFFVLSHVNIAVRHYKGQSSRRALHRKQGTYPPDLIRHF